MLYLHVDSQVEIKYIVLKALSFNKFTMNISRLCCVCKSRS